MKDLTTNILSAFTTALTGITYNSETIQVFSSLPAVHIKKYILLGDIRLSDALSQDQNISNCQMDIEIVTRNYYGQANRTEINAIGNSVLSAIIKKRLTITSCSMTVTPFLIASTTVQQNEGNEIVLTKNITIQFNVEET